MPKRKDRIVFSPEPMMTESFKSNFRIERRRDLEARLGLSRSTIYDKLNPRSPRFDATFPKPIRLGGCAVGWLTHEVDGWLNQQIAARRTVSE